MESELVAASLGLSEHFRKKGEEFLQGSTMSHETVKMNSTIRKGNSKLMYLMLLWIE